MFGEVLQEDSINDICSRNWSSRLEHCFVLFPLPRLSSKSRVSQGFWASVRDRTMAYRRCSMAAITAIIVTCVGKSP